MPLRTPYGYGAYGAYAAAAAAYAPAGYGYPHDRAYSYYSAPAYGGRYDDRDGRGGRDYADRRDYGSSRHDPYRR